MLRFSNAAAAASCTKLGAMPSVPTLAEVQSLLDGKNQVY
jgi:sugar/nucleoside kinase (ribokinase family)